MGTPKKSPRSLKPAHSLQKLLNIITHLIEQHSSKPSEALHTKCLYSPFPYINGCAEKVIHSHQRLLDANSEIQEFLMATPRSHCQDLVENLKNVAEAFTCGEHGNVALKFAYHWLAETALPSMLEYMGWKKDPESWICLRCDEDQERSKSGLEIVQEKSKRDDIYGSLNKLAIGVINVEEALQDLMKHWLCVKHKRKSQELIQQFSDKLVEYLHRSNRETRSPLNAPDYEFPRCIANEDKTGHQPDGGSDLTDNVDLVEDSCDSPTPAPRSRRNIPLPKTSSTVTGSDTSNDTPKHQRPPMLAGSFSEGSRRSMARDNPSASSKTRSVSTTEHLSPSPDESRKRRRKSDTSAPKRSPLSPESENPQPTPQSACESGPSSSSFDSVMVSPAYELSDDPHSSITNSAQEGSLPFPNWTVKIASRSRSDVVASICKVMKEPACTSAKNPDEGWIYIFSSPDFPGYVKIGRTTREIKTRMREQEKKCKSYLLEMADDEECFNKISWHQRLEELIHEDLSNERRYFTCTCKKLNPKHNSKENKNTTAHGEWFEIDETYAKYVVNKWKDWMRLNPYARDGQLTQYMQGNVDKWQRNNKSFDRRVEGRGKEPLLQEMSWWQHLVAWTVTELFEPRLGKPSRWISIQAKWKDYLILIMAHWIFSLFICFSSVFWSWIPPLVLAAVFPLLWTLYDL